MKVVGLFLGHLMSALEVVFKPLHMHGTQRTPPGRHLFALVLYSHVLIQVGVAHSAGADGAAGLGLMHVPYVLLQVGGGEKS